MSVFTRMKLTIAASALVIGSAAGLAAANTGAPNQAPPTQAERQAMHEKHKAEMLQKFDTNKDGKLDDTEKAAAQDQRATERFSKLDTNGDGQISLAEFKAGKQGRMGRMGHHGHRRGGFNK